MDAKKYIVLGSGLAAAALLVPGLVMVFKSPAGFNTAVLILAALHVVAMALSVLGAVFVAIRPKGTAVVFNIAGAAAVLCLLLTLFMLLSMEITVLLTAAGTALMFTAARICAVQR